MNTTRQLSLSLLNQSLEILALLREYMAMEERFIQQRCILSGDMLSVVDTLLHMHGNTFSLEVMKLSHRPTHCSLAEKILLDMSNKVLSLLSGVLIVSWKIV